LLGDPRQKQHADRVAAGLGQAEAGHIFVQLVRDLQQNARAVAGLRIAAASSAVTHVSEHGHGVAHDRV
jgi:hypothetical protein